MSFNDYVRENIFEPLGMNRSTFEEPLPDDLAEGMATSYGVEAGRYVEKPFEIISNFGPAGAMSATATDMVRFGQALLNGGELDGERILKPETVEQMLAPAFSHDDRLMGMALGFYATDYNGFRVVGHGGDTRWFHSYLGIDPENELTFFVSFGAGGGSPVRSAFAPALYNEYYPQEQQRPRPPEDFSERAGRYAGAYGFWRTNFSSIEKAFRMTSVVQVAPTEEGTLIVALGDGAKQYVEVEENLFRQLNPDIALLSGVAPALMAFQENEDGEITGFVLDGLPFMSLRRLSVIDTPSFNFTLLGLAVFVFLGVAARRFYARALIRSWPPEDRSAYLAAFRVSAIQLGTLVAGGIVLTAVGDNLFTEIPFLFKAWLVLPILATLAGLYLAYRTVLVWSGGTFSGLWPRIRYSIVAAGALFMCWFYWYWNILGFQYY